MVQDTDPHQRRVPTIGYVVVVPELNSANVPARLSE